MFYSEKAVSRGESKNGRVLERPEKVCSCLIGKTGELPGGVRYHR